MFVLDVDFLFTFVLKKYTLVDLIDIRAIIYIIVENVLQCLSCTSQIKSNTIDIKKKNTSYYTIVKYQLAFDTCIYLLF